MYIPNIPGISTSVVDKSVIKKIINNNRTILLPGFFKYGKEGFDLSSTVEEFKEKLGEMNLSKYGNAYLFGELAAKTSNVLHYRLLPSDATYANNVVDYNGTYSTKTNITSKDQIFITLDEEGNVANNTSMFSALAKNRGDGYNSIFVTFSPAYEFEKSYTNSDGELQYKFNFVQVDVYEESVNGIRTVSDPIIFSLMEKDEITGQPIVDKTTGKSLYVNHIFSDSNDYVTLMINDKFNKELSKYQNIDSLLKQKKEDSTSIYKGIDGRFIVKDIDDDRYYELYIETYYTIEPNELGVGVRTKKNRINTRITNRLPRDNFLPIFHYIENETHYVKEVVVQDGEIFYTNEGVQTKLENLGISQEDLPNSYFLDGDDALYEMWISNYTIQNEAGEDVISPDAQFRAYKGAVTSTTEASVDPDTGVETPATSTTSIDYLRFALYENLLTYSMQLYSGSDGENLYDSTGALNMYSDSSTVFSQNAKTLLLDFYNNNQEIREVLYPKYDFDYIPDWTGDGRIQSAIILLADDIGTTMPIIGLPLDYNPKIITKELEDRDLDMRKNGLFWSSYNSMLYSGQINKSHILDSGERIYMGSAYYALAAHLKIDSQYGITEPVANIIKGAIDTDVLNLTYAPSSLKIEELRNQQVNCIIEEPDGTYFIDQLTMYKKASKLSRGNIIKVVHRIKKDLPKLLKDLIQVKSTSNITGIAVERTLKYLDNWKVSAENEQNGIFETVNVNGVYNNKTYKLRLSVTVNPIGTIESIDIPIIII